jgi:FAD/FMN-containing dehydrogenase
LARTYGLASDNLLLIAFVTANGQLLTTSATEHEDLFWGLRGGGGNFGVVTSFEYQLHRVSPVLAGVVIHPFENAKAVLTFYREFSHAARDELASGGVLMTMPDGLPVAGIVVCYNGLIEIGGTGPATPQIAAGRRDWPQSVHRSPAASRCLLST